MRLLKSILQATLFLGLLPLLLGANALAQERTPAGTYTVTVTGTSGSTTHTTTLTLTVN